MNLLLIGHCHVKPMQQCLSVMTDCSVETLNAQQLRMANADPEAWYQDLARKAAWADHICVLTVCASLVMDRLPAAKVTLVPTIRCNAYHPDETEVTANGMRIGSLTGPAHSRLAFFAYCQGYTVAETLSLFKADTFETLGYLKEWTRTLAYAQTEEDATGWPMVRQYEAWRRGPAFMLNRHHPKLFAHADLCRMLVRRLGLKMVYDAPETLLADEHGRVSGWPVYPGIADRFGLEGSYFFLVPAPIREEQGIETPAVALEPFLTDAFARFDRYPRQSLSADLEAWPGFSALAAEPTPTRGGPTPPANVDAAGAGDKPQHPYADIPAHQHWRRALAGKPLSELDPIVATKFRIGRGDKVATAGSCFAQHISKALVGHGFDFFRTEDAPKDMPAEDVRARQLDIYSARYGNIYTARQLLQLFDRAFGRLPNDDEVWRRPDGRVVDPYRPTVEPSGYARESDLFEARDRHLAAVRRLFEELDIFLFTLGMTEAWRRKADGMVYPIAPGVAAGRYEPARHEFVNFSAEEVVADLRTFLAQLRAVNPKARLILTVSPVPPAATFEPQHVLSAGIYTKSALRVAAEILTRENDCCDYFPGYEVVVSPSSKGVYFEEDRRAITPAGVEHVTRLFLQHYTCDAPAPSRFEAEDTLVICDDDLLM